MEELIYDRSGFEQGRENYDRLLSVFHTVTEAKRCLLEFFLKARKLNLFDWLTSLNHTVLQFEDVQRAIRRSSHMQVTELELNTIDTLLKSNCFDMFCDDCLLNSRLENVLNSHKEELYKIYQNSDRHHNVSQYTPSLTKYEWELLFKTGDLWGFNEEGYDHYISASKDITLSSLDINLRYSILYIICPLFKSVNVISECQIQIAKIAVLQTELEDPQFKIWDTIEAQIVIIGRHCKLFDYFQRKCTTIKNTKFNRSLSQENRKYILVHAFKNPIFLQDREFCERTRKELDLIKFEENLNMAEKLLGREITIELEDGKYEIGSYSRRVIDIADKNLNIRKAVSATQIIGTHKKNFKGEVEFNDMQEEINRHNHLKLVQLITSFGNNVLVDVLKQRLPDAEFGYAFKGMRSRIIPLLNNHEQQLLYPDRGYYKGDLSDLDISLVYIILRNLNTICPHRNGWGNKPNDDDRCLSANIERIRIFRNMYVSHCSNYSLNDEDFHMTWKEIRQCILQLGGKAYTEKIDSLLTTEINPVVAKELYNTLEKLKAAKIQNEKYTVILEEYQHDLKQQSNIIHRQHSENTPTHNGSLGKGNVSLKLKMEGQNIPSVKNIEDLIQDTTTEDVRIVYANDGSILIGLEVSPSVFLKIGDFLDRIDKLLSSLLQRYSNYGNGQTSRVIVFVDFTDTCNESLDDGEPSLAIEGDRDDCLERTGMIMSVFSRNFIDIHSQCERETRVILIGKTGSGKSSLGNALLQKHIFKTGCHSSSITKTCSSHTERINGNLITVIDTPGLCNPNENDDTKTEIEKYIRLSFPRPYVILNVISIGQFTDEDYIAIKTFTTKFGGDVNRYHFLILTRLDEYKRDNNIDIFSFESWKNNLSSKWKTLLNETFEDRCLPFDNTLSGNASVKQAFVLLQKVDQIMSSANNVNSCTNEDFKKAEPHIQQAKIVDELRRKRNYAIFNELLEQNAREELGFMGETIEEFQSAQVKLRMEMGNVSKRQQPDHKKDNSRRSEFLILEREMIQRESEQLRLINYELESEIKKQRNQLRVAKGQMRLKVERRHFYLKQIMIGIFQVVRLVYNISALFFNF